MRSRSSGAIFSFMCANTWFIAAVLDHVLPESMLQVLLIFQRIACTRAPP